MGADLNKAKKHELANTVKRPDVDLAKREICLDCKQYIPKQEDRFPFWSTNTDELWFLGTGIPVYFTFMKRLAIFMLLISLFFVSVLSIQSSILYKKLEIIDLNMHNDMSYFVVGTNYAVSAFRITYGFDFGVWMKFGYMHSIVIIQICMYIFATYLTASLDLKNRKLRKVANKPSDFALEVEISEETSKFLANLDGYF